ncbi:hypothetical protein K466DRAFT_508255, partial [Polyporus arcularius HHB13444]
KEEEESEDKLLLTEASNCQLNEEIKVETILQQHTQPKKGRPKYFIFHAQHPQAHTHHIALVDGKDGYIPNFIGGSLPQKDVGSWEEYCMTMLTLFKPWRSGNDLRVNFNTLWDELYASFKFTD